LAWAWGGGIKDHCPPWILNISAKKVVFSFSGGKKNLDHFFPPLKNFGKTPSERPWEKFFRQPCRLIGEVVINWKNPSKYL